MNNLPSAAGNLFSGDSIALIREFQNRYLSTLIRLDLNRSHEQQLSLLGGVIAPLPVVIRPSLLLQTQHDDFRLKWPAKCLKELASGFG